MIVIVKDNLGILASIQGKESLEYGYSAADEKSFAVGVECSV